MSECSWLREPLICGEIVEEFTGPTYGAVSPEGIAITRLNPDGGKRFTEIPQDALEIISDD